MCSFVVKFQQQIVKKELFCEMHRTRVLSTYASLQDPGVPEALPLRHTWVVWQQLASPGKTVPYEQSTKQTLACFSSGCAGLEPGCASEPFDRSDGVDCALAGLMVRINTATQDCVREFGGGIRKLRLVVEMQLKRCAL